jgi:hypothetical protein
MTLLCGSSAEPPLRCSKPMLVGLVFLWLREGVETPNTAFSAGRPMPVQEGRFPAEAERVTPGGLRPGLACGEVGLQGVLAWARPPPDENGKAGVDNKRVGAWPRPGVKRTRPWLGLAATNPCPCSMWLDTRLRTAVSSSLSWNFDAASPSVACVVIEHRSGDVAATMACRPPPLSSFSLSTTPPCLAVDFSSMML